MNRYTGQPISTLDHITQSIVDVLTTRLGTRIMRREYGSQLPDLIDAPFNSTTRVRLYAATAIALMRWEPRVRISRVQLTDITLAGAIEMQLEATLVDSNAALNLRIPLRMGA